MKTSNQETFIKSSAKGQNEMILERTNELVEMIVLCENLLQIEKQKFIEAETKMIEQLSVPISYVTMKSN
jgi:hypothetical protein